VDPVGGSVGGRGIDQDEPVIPSLSWRYWQGVVGTLLVLLIAGAVLRAAGVIEGINSLFPLLPPSLMIHHAVWMWALPHPKGASEQTHWRMFNRMARFVGIWFCLGGSGFLAWSVFFLLHPDDPRRFTPDGSDSIIVDALAGSFVVCVGSFLLFKKPYRPDLGDRAFVRGDDRSRRKWWTGDWE
jgi:hypothetical protein